MSSRPRLNLRRGHSQAQAISTPTSPPALSSSVSGSGSGLGSGSLDPPTSRAPNSLVKAASVEIVDAPPGVGTYNCGTCACVVAMQTELVSRAFRGSSGPASLFNSTINTDLSDPTERELVTGRHTVCDIKCAACQANLGWVYVKTPDSDQAYKEGRYILEMAYVIKENGWS